MSDVVNILAAPLFSYDHDHIACADAKTVSPALCLTLSVPSSGLQHTPITAYADRRSEAEGLMLLNCRRPAHKQPQLKCCAESRVMTSRFDQLSLRLCLATPSARSTVINAQTIIRNNGRTTYSVLSSVPNREPAFRSSDDSCYSQGKFMDR